MFIHDAILEACLCGETGIPVNEFALTYKEMLKVDSQSNTSQLREEFQVIHTSTRFVYCMIDHTKLELFLLHERRKVKMKCCFNHNIYGRTSRILRVVLSLQQQYSHMATPTYFTIQNTLSLLLGT